jgi:hypothetical protein
MRNANGGHHVVRRNGDGDSVATMKKTLMTDMLAFFFGKPGSLVRHMSPPASRVPNTATSFFRGSLMFKEISQAAQVPQNF